MFAVQNEETAASVSVGVRRFVADALRAGQSVQIDQLTQSTAQDLWKLASGAGAQPYIRLTATGWIFRTNADFLH